MLGDGGWDMEREPSGVRTVERVLAKNGSGMQIASLSPGFRLHSSKFEYPHWTRELTVSCT